MSVRIDYRSLSPGTAHLSTEGVSAVQHLMEATVCRREVALLHKMGKSLLSKIREITVIVPGE